MKKPSLFFEGFVFEGLLFWDAGHCCDGIVFLKMHDADSAS